MRLLDKSINALKLPSILPNVNTIEYFDCILLNFHSVNSPSVINTPLYSLSPGNDYKF